LEGGQGAGQEARQVKVKNCSVELEEEEGTNFITAFSHPVYGSTVQNSLFCGFGTSAAIASCRPFYPWAVQ